MKKKILLLIGFCVIILASCQQNAKKSNHQPQKKGKRYAMVTGLKPTAVARYKELHAHAWPGVLKKLSQCHIENYSIYLKEIDGKPYLFSYWEYTGNNFDADMKKMAADSTTQRWWKETNPLQSPLPDASAKNEIWSPAEEVFHLN